MKDKEICQECNFPFDLCICKKSDNNINKIMFDFHTKKVKNRNITIIEFSNNNINLKPILKTLRKRLGVGGVIRDTIIEIQGNHYIRLIKIITELGYEYKHKDTLDNLINE